MVLFAIDLSTRKVEILGTKLNPDSMWMEQIARNMVDCEEGFLKNKKYLIHDRDPLYTFKFCAILKSEGIEAIKLPPHSPNLNSVAERFVRTVREECLTHLILSYLQKSSLNMHCQNFLITTILDGFTREPDRSLIQDMTATLVKSSVSNDSADFSNRITAKRLDRKILYYESVFDSTVPVCLPITMKF